MRQTILFMLIAFLALRSAAACSLWPVPSSSAATSSTAASAEPTESAAATATPAPTVSPVPTPNPTPTATPVPSPAPSPTPTVTPTPSPTPSPTPTPDPYAATPDQAGTDTVLFDIYQDRALADLNQDGTMERIEWVAGSSSSELRINDVPYAIPTAGLAQLFAVTDIDRSDGLLEIVLTEPYAELADTEFPYSHFFWWDGSDAISMGSVSELKFHGAWRAAFNPAAFLDGDGLIMTRARSIELTDVWYTGHYIVEGAQRAIREKAYATAPLYPVEPLTARHDILLLKRIDSQYFGSDYAVLWDFASGTATLDRDYSDDIISFLPRAGESLQVVRIYGKYWFKLQAADGKSGWLKCVGGQVQGYYQVMGLTAADLFDGIFMAG